MKRSSTGDNAASPFDEPIARLLAQAGTVAVIEPRCQVFQPGQPVREIAFVLSGALRVFQFCYEGKEIGLYRVRNGEVCSLSLLSATTDTPFPAWAETETRLRAAIVPARTFRQWLKESDHVRNFVFAGLRKRLLGVLELLTEVAFRRTESRLAAFLAAEAGGAGKRVLALTHDNIAAELGTSREVVSRLLESFERDGALRLTRGRIQLNSGAISYLKQRQQAR